MEKIETPSQATKKMLTSRVLRKDSFKLAFGVLGGIDIILSFLSLSLSSIESFWTRLGIVIVTYFVLVVSVLFVKFFGSRKEAIIDVRSIKVTVKQGDIFNADGWRVIPFNEYYDTQVDDVVINKKSLNGQLILDHLDDDGREALEEAISADDTSKLTKHFEDATQKWQYPLGRIKSFSANDQSYLLLALTHFNAQNEAHTNRGEFEQTLRTMWEEIDRTYAQKPVYLPLIGTGATRLDDMTSKPNAEFLKCLICTLRTSKVTLTAPVTILLTAEAMEKVNLYELKGIQ
jgi:hypothetical protein